MNRTLPLATNAMILAIGRTFVAFVFLVSLQRLAGIFFAAELTFVRQFGNSLLNGQIS